MCKWGYCTELTYDVVEALQRILYYVSRIHISHCFVLDLHFDDEAIHKRTEYNNFGCSYVAYLIALGVIIFNYDYAYKHVRTFPRNKVDGRKN